jgi:DNA-binding SARP family transcriptional activator
VETWYVSRVGAVTSQKGVLFVRLLGEVNVLRDGSALSLPASRKTRALLAYLVAARTPQSRQRLCDLFWDGPDDPRAALRWSLTKLRPVVDGPGVTRIVADRERVAFSGEGVGVDLFEVNALVGASAATAGTDALRRAAAALRGDFLEGLDLPDCYRFHEWCSGERERVRALRLAVLDALVERTSDAPEEALGHARQRLASDPLADTAHASVVRLLARLGRKADALAQVETCRRILERELGGRRSPALDAARLEIGRAVPVRDVDAHLVRTPSVRPIAPVAAPVSVATPTGRQRLVAREEERAAIEALADGPAAGRGQIALFTGEAGIGKSRLLEELAVRVREKGGLVLEARAFEAEAVRPYGMWIDLLRDRHVEGLLEKRRAELAPLLPGGVEGPRDPETGARLFDAVAHLLRDLAASSRVVLVIDDLHWLDAASAGLLHYVARVCQGEDLAIACAARDGELSDNPDALRFVRSLHREGRLATLRLAPLDEAATGELVGALTSAEAARIFRESGGNPLFALEVARADAPGADASRPLSMLLDQRLARLDARARELSVWASALDRNFDPELLARVSGESLAQTVGAIGALEAQGLLTSTDGTTYTFTHELVRRAAYRQLSGPRCRLVHLTIARALEAARQWGDVVHHASLAGDGLLVARACIEAGDRCLRMAARRQAKELAERGIVHARRLDPPEGVHLRAELLRVAALSAVADPSRRQAYEEEAEQVARLAHDARLAQDEATALFALSLLTSNRADFEETHGTTLRQAAAAREAAPEASVPALANTAFCLALIERELPRARALLDEASELARAHRLWVIDLDLGSGLLSHFEGDATSARVLFRRAIDAAHAAGDYWRVSVGLTRYAMLTLESGAWDETCGLARELREVAAKLGDGTEGLTADALEALALQASGDARGRGRLEVAVRALELADARATLAFALTMAAENDLRAGDLASAGDYAARALPVAGALGKPSAAIRAHVAMGRAVPVTAAAHLAEARALVDHPYGVSRSARDAVATLAASMNSNGDINDGAHGPGPGRRRR